MKWKPLKHSLLLFTVMSIAVALITFYNLFLKINAIAVKWDYLLISVFFQILSIFTVILSWKFNLRINKVAKISWIEATSHIGLNSLGKYSPGKVIGSFARGVSAYKCYGNINGIIYVSIIEQVAMIHSGLVLYALVFLLGKYQLLADLIILCSISISLILIPILIKSLLNVFGHKFSFIIKDYIPNKSLVFLLSYLVTYFLLSVVWLSTSISLKYIAEGFGVGLDLSTSVLATTSAYLSGFAAVFLPAGIGVREGVIALYIADITTISVASSIALILRIITIGIDIILGLFALRKFSLREN